MQFSLFVQRIASVKVKGLFHFDQTCALCQCTLNKRELDSLLITNDRLFARNVEDQLFLGTFRQIHRGHHF